MSTAPMTDERLAELRAYAERTTEHARYGPQIAAELLADRDRATAHDGIEWRWICTRCRLGGRYLYLSRDGMVADALAHVCKTPEDADA